MSRMTDAQLEGFVADALDFSRDDVLWLGDEARRARAREADLERERDEWQRVTGQPDPDALASYLSRETLPESNERTGRVIADLSSRLSASQERERVLVALLVDARLHFDHDDAWNEATDAALQSPPTPAPEPEAPTWACRGCGFSGPGFSTVTHSAGDCDVECPECGSDETSESAEEALRIVVDELDTLRASPRAPESEREKRLAKALDAIEDGACDGGWDGCDRKCAQIARAALSKSED